MRRTDSQGTFLAGFLPAAMFHHHAYDDAHRLPQSLGAPRMLGCQKAIDVGNRLQLAHHPRQRRPIVVHFRFFHSPLPAFVVEKRESLVEGLLGVVHDVGKRASLAIFKKLLPGNRSHWHRSSALGPRVNSKIGPTNIVCQPPRIASSNVRPTVRGGTPSQRASRGATGIYSRLHVGFLPVRYRVFLPARGIIWCGNTSRL